LKKSVYEDIDGFVLTGLPDASVVGMGLPDASVEEEENMLLMLPNIPPDDDGDGFPDASVVVGVGLPDASVEEEENMLPNIPPDDDGGGFPDASVASDEEKILNGSLFDENNALIEVVPFKNDVII
jgi:hypothetical protein